MSKVTPLSDSDPRPPAKGEPRAAEAADVAKARPPGEGAGSDRDVADTPDPPSLIWPPPEDELHDWEVLHLNSTGNTLIDVMKYQPERPQPPAPAGPAARSGYPTGTQPFAPPAAPPASEAPSGGGGPENLAETQLIEPLTRPEEGLPVDPPTIPNLQHVRPPSATRPPAPRRIGPPPLHEPGPDDTNPGLITRIIPVPPQFRNPAAPPGRAPQPTPPPQSPPARETTVSMADTLPAGIPRARVIAPETWPGSDPAGGAGRAAPPPRSVPRDASTRPEPVEHKYEYVPPPQPAPPQPTPPASIDAYQAGAPIPEARRPSSSRSAQLWRVVVWVLALAIVIQLAFLFLRTLRGSAEPLSLGTIVVESAPSGAEVLVDGEPRGKTPFRAELAAGPHRLEVRSGETRRPLAVTVQGGALSSHYVDLAGDAGAEPPAAAGATAAIEVRSDPPGARVEIGGVSRGTTPVIVPGLEPGRYEVKVSGPFRAITRHVTATAGEQALVVVTPARGRDAGSGGGNTSSAPPDPAPAPPPTARGFFTVQSPLVLRVIRNGEWLGTSEDTRLALPPGSHVVSLENDSVGFREQRTIEIVSGRTTEIPVQLPQGALNINARPWAEVFIDGQRVAETPIAQLALPVGVHEIVFRHPTFGERRVTALVKVGVPGRAFVDFTR